MWSMTEFRWWWWWSISALTSTPVSVAFVYAVTCPQSRAERASPEWMLATKHHTHSSTRMDTLRYDTITSMTGIHWERERQRWEQNSKFSCAIADQSRELWKRNPLLSYCQSHSWTCTLGETYHTNKACSTSINPSLCRHDNRTLTRAEINL